MAARDSPWRTKMISVAPSGGWYECCRNPSLLWGPAWGYCRPWPVSSSSMPNEDEDTTRTTASSFDSLGVGLEVTQTLLWRDHIANAFAVLHAGAAALIRIQGSA